jgi:phosphoribosyl 1,2-cyclic phosphodiesterase
LKFAVLGSGSSGNAYLIREGGTLILADAGFSFRQLKLRMDVLGLSPGDLTAVVVTHEHADHVQGLPLLLRRHPLPLYATAGTLDGLPDLCPRERHILRPGQAVSIGAVRLSPFAVSHDARDAIGFAAEDASGRRLGLASDLGVMTEPVLGHLQECHLLALEANHDEEMLRRGPYPFPVQQRIRSMHGHLSNRQMCHALRDLIHEGLHCVIPIHLSRTNNDPILVKYGVTEVLEKTTGPGIGCRLSSQHDVLPFLEV